MNAAAGEEPAAAGVKPADPISEMNTPGELLRVERERRQWSIQQAAEDLHLDTWMIEAIEANRFSALGAPVYAKGHLRKYAILLGISPETVLDGYQALRDTPVVSAPIPPIVKAPALTGRRSFRTPLLLLAALVTLGVAWWAFERWSMRDALAPLLTPMSGSVEAPITGGQPVAPAPTQSSTESPVIEEPAIDSSPASSESSVTPQTPAPSVAAPADASVRLQLEFSGPSWTEVYDGEGRRLMFGMGAPGLVRTLSGTPPLRVNLGAVSAVTATVNDEPIVIPRRADRNATRFVIDAAGAVSSGAGG